MKKLALSSLFVLLFSVFPASSVLADDVPVGDVEGLEAEALDGAVKLTWLPATADLGVEGYEVHYSLTPVTETGMTYEHSENVGDVLEYTVTGLENDTTYYFSAIAYDSEGNESVHWADEVSATPQAEDEEDDGEAPQVADAEAVNKEQVLVVFTKAIVLPEEDPQDSFMIENNEDFTELVVLDAEIYEEDESGETVLLTTEDQEEDVEYTLTAHSVIQDTFGNPIISGTSDTAVFTGSGLEPEEEEEVEPLQLLDVQSINSTSLGVHFNRAVVLGIDPVEHFVIHSVDDPDDVLTVHEVSLSQNFDGVDDAFALLTTSNQEDKTYTLTVVGLTDEDGNEIDEDKNTMPFEGPAAPVDEDEDEDEELPEITPPADVANFLARAVFEADKVLVNLSWTLPVDPDWTSVLQRLYVSMNLGETYDVEAELDPDVTEYSLEDLEPGEYWFKLTQEDEEGNESEGVVTRVTISETGPGILGLMLVSLGLGRLVTKKRT